MFRGEHSVCIEEEGDGFGYGTCVISNGTEIAIARASVRTNQSVLHFIRMFVSGDGMQQLHDPGRKVRLLAYLSETRVYEPRWTMQTENLVSQTVLEQVAQVVLVVANEGLVVGVEESASLRDALLPEKRNVTTVSALAFVPASILLVMGLVLAAYDVIVRMSIAKMECKERCFHAGLFRIHE